MYVSAFCVHFDVVLLPCRPSRFASPPQRLPMALTILQMKFWYQWLCLKAAGIQRVV
jgi:hypothetical protein